MKNVRLIRKDENAVSPVIATILMVAITVVLAAVLYVMVSGLLSGPGNAPTTLGVGRQGDTAYNWVLEIIDTGGRQHSLGTTTFQMRWPTNQSNLPLGVKTLEALKTKTQCVQYVPTSGGSQADLRVNDQIVISKSCSYETGMALRITDGDSQIWSGTL